MIWMANASGIPVTYRRGTNQLILAIALLTVLTGCGSTIRGQEPLLVTATASNFITPLLSSATPSPSPVTATASTVGCDPIPYQRRTTNTECFWLAYQTCSTINYLQLVQADTTALGGTITPATHILFFFSHLPGPCGVIVAFDGLKQLQCTDMIRDADGTVVLSGCNRGAIYRVPPHA